LFSLPRSGSTLAQRTLATHAEISTVSEPWILLPYLYTLKKDDIYAEYSHRTMVKAVEDFCRTLPNGTSDYLGELRELTLRLYAKAGKNGARYFLDKTPRYHLVVEDVIHLFPEGKFIFLWRNPLSIIASITNTWANGTWKLWRHKVDLFRGLDNLVHAYSANKDLACALRYEDMLANPESEWKRVFRYLELPFEPERVLQFSRVDLRGRMGDPVGTKQYKQISDEPIEKWKTAMGNPFRKAWCRNYLRWIGSERLAVMGYNMDELLGELDSVPVSLQFLVSDLLRVPYGAAHHAMRKLQEKMLFFS